MNSGIGAGIIFERVGTKGIELKDFELEWRKKELGICYFYDAGKDILQTVESIVVQEMVF